MPTDIKYDPAREQYYECIPLKVAPARHHNHPTLTSSPLSTKPKLVIFGDHFYEFYLPGGDRLRLIAPHNSLLPQIILISNKLELLKDLPCNRDASLVSKTIASIQIYLQRSQCYAQPLSEIQEQKKHIAAHLKNALNDLLQEEQHLTEKAWCGQEALRKKVLNLIESAQDSNRMLTCHPFVSEGSLGSILYQAKQTAHHFQFDPFNSITAQDQLAFDKNTYVWDSQLHLKDPKDIENSIGIIAHHYNLPPSGDLTLLPASRIDKFGKFLTKTWQDTRKWADYLSLPHKPHHTTEKSKIDDIQVTRIHAYYRFLGKEQKIASSLEELMQYYDCTRLNSTAENEELGSALLANADNGVFLPIESSEFLLVKEKNRIRRYQYFKDENGFMLLPDTDDLMTICQASERHLYWPERAYLHSKAFFTRLAGVFPRIFTHTLHFIRHDFVRDFRHHVHKDHRKVDLTVYDKKQHPFQHAIETRLRDLNYLKKEESLEDFVQKQLGKKIPTVVHSQHYPVQYLYDNPFHRIFNVVRHFVGFFSNTGEEHPITGTLAMFAYLYGGGAIVAPQILNALFNKFHTYFLQNGIHPTQVLGGWMSNGTMSEALSAAVTYWQGVTMGGNLDRFFMDILNLVKDNPAEVAIVCTLAIGLGYGICQAIPALEKEMGTFPLPNYATLGAKGGAAIYDTIMHPGDDWLLGSIKWALRFILIPIKLLFAPIVEGYHYGFRDGFINGMKKSTRIFRNIFCQSMSALADLGLNTLSFFCMELLALLVHIPFRGISNATVKILSTAGHVSDVGLTLKNFSAAMAKKDFMQSFRFSPLYGFTLWRNFHRNVVLNSMTNLFANIALLPLQLFKNFLILPVLDSISLSIRFSLQTGFALFNALASPTGWLLYGFGLLSDHSMGYLFRGAARFILHTANRIDNVAAKGKKTILASLNHWRSQLYYWAFLDDKELIRRSEFTPKVYMDSTARILTIVGESSIQNILQQKATPKGSPQKITHTDSQWTAPDESVPCNSPPHTIHCGI